MSTRKIIFGGDAILLSSTAFMASLYTALFNRKALVSSQENPVKEYLQANNLNIFKNKISSDDAVAWFEGVNKLSAHHNLVVTTSLPWPAASAAEKYLKDSLNCSISVEYVESNAMLDLACDVYVGYNPSEVELMSRKAGQAYLIKHDYDDKEAIPPGVVRLNNWQDFFQIVKNS